MRLIETESKWLNACRRAYFANGKRVTESKFDKLLDAEMRIHAMPSLAGKAEKTCYGFRTIWQSES